MNSSSPRRFLAVLLAAVLLGPALPAAADDPECPIPPVADVYAYQTPDATALTGRIAPVPACPTIATVKKLDGSAEISFEGDTFELPLGTESGTWYLASITTWPGDTRTFEPVAPNLLRVLDLTRITSTAPTGFAAYGDRFTVSGYLEGWTPAGGWQRMPGRPLTIRTGNGWDGNPTVPTVTDASGEYRLTVPLYNTYGGAAVFAGDEQWLSSASFNDVQVHGLVDAKASDRTPNVGERVLISGKVAPGAVPVWLERLVGTEWVKVGPTVTAAANGRYRLTYRPTTRGVHQLRVWNDGTDPETRLGVQPAVANLRLVAHR
ncbi:hypothetical protein [Kribbella sp. NPDC051770]|uniref:hypothetical protein n=1 Tax=Kribbella sp. NPDC051770 TaxID=3155413 RepID=UPI00343031EF